jgi:hypothetical protein
MALAEDGMFPDVAAPGCYWSLDKFFLSDRLLLRSGYADA